MIRFEFKPLNEIVEISSMERDFSNKVICDIRRKVKNGEIRKWHCFTNAVVVAEILVKNGETGITIIDGFYSLAGGEQDAHRFIKQTRPNGIVRYYDPSLEFLPKMTPASSFVHHARREFDLPVIQAFGQQVERDCLGNGFLFTEPELLTQTSTFDYFLCPHPYLKDNGEYVGIISVCERLNYPIPAKQAA